VFYLFLAETSVAGRDMNHIYSIAIGLSDYKK